MGIVLQFKDDFFLFSGISYIQLQFQVTMNLTATSNKTKIDGSPLIRGLILTLTGDPLFIDFIRTVLLGTFLRSIYSVLLVPVAVRSKAKVCGRSPAEIVGSNPTGGTGICCEC